MEKIFSGRILVTDMDGTLLDSGSKVGKRNMEAIGRFINGGGLFTVATGRMNRAVEPYQPYIPMNMPAIVYNGAAIYDFHRQKMLWSNCMSVGARELAKIILEEFPEAGLEIFHGTDLYIVSRNRYTDSHMEREGFRPIYAELKEVPDPWFKMLIAWSPEKLLMVEELLTNKLGGDASMAGGDASMAGSTPMAGGDASMACGTPMAGDDASMACGTVPTACSTEPFTGGFSMVYSEPDFLEILDSNVSKGNALRILSGIMNFPLDSTVAIGDNRNDVELLKAAGRGVAVANAHPLAMEAADIVCRHHDEDAIAEVVEWMEGGRI